MGNALLEMVILATGLPEREIRRELQALIFKHGKTPESVTIEDLRVILADYLQDVILSSKEETYNH